MHPLVDCGRGQMVDDINIRDIGPRGQVADIASDDLNAQADRLKAELQSHVKNLSLELAEKVVGANMNRDTNSALVDRYIAELGAKQP